MRLNLYRFPSAGWGPASFVVFPKKPRWNALKNETEVQALLKISP